MFLSHVLAIAFGISLLPFGIMSSNHNFWVRIIGFVGFILAAYATYKLGRTRWIWIGPTSDQMRMQLQSFQEDVQRLELALGPEAPPLTVAQRQMLIASRRKLLRRCDKLSIKMSDYSATERPR
jgi:hypothetical protein